MATSRSPCRLEPTDSAEHQERAASVRRMIAESEVKAGEPAPPSSITILMRDLDDAVMGGSWGEVRRQWQTLGTLVVPEGLRGQHVGRRPVMDAEDRARARGCVGSHTDTCSLQARGFHEALDAVSLGTWTATHPATAGSFSKRFA